jgi:branched-chain amino acid transport system permease protein
MGIAESLQTPRRELLEGQSAGTIALAALVGLVAVYLFVTLLVGLVTGDVLVSQVLSKVKTGVMRGLVIGLAGIGLSLTYSILNFANFAHGDYLSVGAFAGWSVTYLVAGLGSVPAIELLLMSPQVYGSSLGISVLGAPLAVVLGALAAGAFAIALALVLDRVVYKPMREQDGITLLIASIGVAFVLRYMIVFVWTQAQRGTTRLDIPRIGLPALDGVVRVSSHDLTLVAVSAALMFGVHLLLQRTKLGTAMRAMADNEDLARITGIPTERVVTWTWVIGAALTGIGGYLLVLWSGTLDFDTGWRLLLLVFAAVILGGIGSVYGAIAGGLVVGLTLSLSTLFIPTGFTRAAAFAIMILILLYRPEGLFAGRTTA